MIGGAKRDRTADLLRARQALSQLSYSPKRDASSYEDCGFTLKNNLCEHSRIIHFVFKEVIQPQVPLRLPCYDFTPVMNHTVVTAQF